MKKWLCAVLCLILLVTCLAGCDNSPKYELFVFYEMVEDGVTYNAADMQKELDSEGKNLKVAEVFYVKLYEDGTATWCSMGVETAMKYSDTEIWSVDDPEERAGFSRSGDTLEVKDGAAKITFKKQ